MSKTSPQTVITGADILVARRRANVNQEDLAAEVGWYKQVLVAVESEKITLSQDDCRLLLSAIKHIEERRKKAATA